MLENNSSKQRVHSLLNHGKFVTLATSGPEGAWSSPVNYVVLYQPLRLLWYSAWEAAHSRYLRSDPRVSGAIFRTGLDGPTPGLDGLQLTGTATEVQDQLVPGVHALYYERNFPDEKTRTQWMLPESEFSGAGGRRFYILTVEQVWLFDLERWVLDKYDQRFAVAESAWPSHPMDEGV
ncbi:pyridoxamine 5'-phosphate oxidase [Haloactinospora alba]|uniref:Pyridoxamine 5'-phosphate oxidase n=1 Tax=Haloactinospora alba TaxID=405555 RepID=A0A543NFL7_9ACTN|nr:pyridoxamine 5'-phosphate oxidase family protein [Haloactinospora alba]TQN30550.1 pyridoxamine 5'-phosphate oxidase [Haloactinospora alba]